MSRHSRFAWGFLFIATFALPMRADDILFIGNSFTFAAEAPVVHKNGGVPKLFEAIAQAKGHQVTTEAVTAAGQDWAYHLAQPVTAAALSEKVWTWIVLQDSSTRPTRIGNVEAFKQDGETFSERIASHSPHAGILLYETWARPPGSFYERAPGNGFTGPAQMMADLHQSYGDLRNDLARKNKTRPARVALVGTAFARAKALYPEISLDAADHHHSTIDGYYLAALVMDEAIYHESVKGAPISFFHGALQIPAADAAKLQDIADRIATESSKTGE